MVTLLSLVRARLVAGSEPAIFEAAYSATQTGHTVLARYRATLAARGRVAYEPTEYRGWLITFSLDGPLDPSATIRDPGGEMQSTHGGGDTSDAALLRRAWDAIDSALVAQAARTTATPGLAPPAPARAPRHRPPLGP